MSVIVFKFKINIKYMNKVNNKPNAGGYFGEYGGQIIPLRLTKKYLYYII